MLCSTQSVQELCGKDSGHCLPIVNCGSNDSSSTLHVPECWQDLAKSWIAIIFKNKQWNTHLLQVYCVLRASAKLKILIEIEIDCTLVVFAFDISKFSQQDDHTGGFHSRVTWSICVWYEANTTLWCARLTIVHRLWYAPPPIEPQ